MYNYDDIAPERQVVFVDEKSDEVIDSKELTDFQKIKLVCDKNEIRIREEPKKGCRKCNGTGRIGYRLNSKEPIACGCIFYPEDIKNTVSYSRSQKRKMIRKLEKQIKKIKKKGNDVKKEI